MELVTVTTADYVRLQGVYSASNHPLRSSVSKGSIDGAVLVHGIGGNFYSSRLLNHFAKTLQELGLGTLIINTRGHDMVNTLSWAGKSRSGGAAFENVDDCRLDLAAWHDLMIERGHSHLLFLGHSLGAIKSLYIAAHAPPKNLRAVVALSPSRLSYRRMMETSTDGKFAATFSLCQKLVSEGRGDDPISVEFPVKTWMTPACYLDKYGPNEKYNWLRFIGRVQVPSLLLFGEKELNQHPAFIGLREDFAQAQQQLGPLRIEIIEDADHFYSSKFDLVDDCMTRWLLK
jgi:pimeloyl-ACP methyl ester carboxylesterase